LIPHGHIYTLFTQQRYAFLPTFSIFLTTNPGFLTTFDIGISVGITGMPDTLYKSFNLLNILQKVRDFRFFLNSHPILADIGKNYYICIGIEALIADRLWNSLPSVNMQNCITFLNALCETGAAKGKWTGLFFQERPGSFLPIPRCPGKENTN
jgi:hypothetical protein